ncbi:translation elongation factor Ts [Algiphilus sp. W345]|uniref:Elongation factor Ts n=1 Tax=Banduia mediterranea TaxID=3075609 RepID=A0ABU2WHC1_9GAMM|nr:translation elongation factor Ts [Algiphilus sp. W345]MDT0497265.1 translation elongation factor Ts [Algiphilus sp. W345]
MSITASLVKELRERTGAAMMDCKKALEATGGDVDAAIEKMRMDGMAKADKKASRVAADGTIAVASSGNALAIVEVNCETDFVAKADDFMAMAQLAGELALEFRPETVESLLQLSRDGRTLDEVRRGLVSKLGENMTVRRFQVLDNAGGALSYYLHGSRIGVAVALKSGDEALAKDLAMHIAASQPKFISAAEVPAEIQDAERKILLAQAEESGKPIEIVEKMIEGRLRKFLAEITLLGQPFVKDPDQTIEKLLKAQGAEVARFVRFEVGEGIEKSEVDFAAEVMATAQATMG